MAKARGGHPPVEPEPSLIREFAPTDSAEEPDFMGTEPTTGTPQIDAIQEIKMDERNSFASVKKLFDWHVAASFDKQLHLSDMLRGRDAWNVDFDAAILSFDDLSWHVQVLGTQSELTRTWLWAWSNSSFEGKSRILEAARSILAYGEQRNLSELTVGELPAHAGHDGHFFSMIACGISNANAYYRGPYDGGAAFLLIDDPAYPSLRPDPVSRIAAVFPQVIAQFDCDHRTAIQGYFSYYGLSTFDDGRRLRASLGEVPSMIAAFDSRGRLTELRVLSSKGD